MRSEIYEQYKQNVVDVIRESHKLAQIAGAFDSSPILFDDFKQYPQQFKEMHYNYRLLLELGYESNGKLPVALKLMQKIEEEKLLNWLTSSEPQQEQRMLYTTLLAEIHQLLLEEQLAWPKFNKKPFLVEAWSWSLQLLEKFSLFYIIRTFLLPSYTRGNYRFVDRWLLFHTILAISYVVLAGMEMVPSW